MSNLSIAESASSAKTESAESLRDQETALVKLGELYRDQQYVPKNNLLVIYDAHPCQECTGRRRCHQQVAVIHVFNSKG